MKVSIGSQNPVKVSVSKDVFSEVFHTHIDFLTCDAQSGVPNQPYGNEEMRAGALHRARDAQTIFPESYFSIGIEGGIEIVQQDYWVTAWVCVLNHEGKSGFGKASAFMLPSAVVSLMKEGMELGHASDIVFKEENSKQKEGTIGLLTHGKVTRADFYRDAVRFALIPFIQTDLYQ